MVIKVFWISEKLGTNVNNLKETNENLLQTNDTLKEDQKKLVDTYVKLRDYKGITYSEIASYNIEGTRSWYSFGFGEPFVYNGSKTSKLLLQEFARPVAQKDIDAAMEELSDQITGLQREE